MANPRKFSEKIALHNQKQAEETAAFEAILRDVHSSTRGPMHKQNQQLHIQQNIMHQYRGGSLPNVNQMATASNSALDLQTALHMDGMRGGAQARLERMHPRDRGRQQIGPGPLRTRPFNMEKSRADCSPYGSGAYLSPPPDTSWRRMLRHLNGVNMLSRTNSDSAIHSSSSLVGGSTGEVPSPNTPPIHRRIQEVVGENSGMSGDMLKGAAFPWDPKKVQQLQQRPKSCEVPNINIYPSGEPDSQMHVPISNNTGSLPDLTILQFPSPLTTPIDIEEQKYGVASGGAPGGGAGPNQANLSPTSAHHMNMVPMGQHPNGSPAHSPGSPRRRMNPSGPSPLVLTGNGTQPMRHPHSPPVTNIDPTRLQMDPRIRQQYMLYMQQQQQRRGGAPMGGAAPHPHMSSPPGVPQQGHVSPVNHSSHNTQQGLAESPQHGHPGHIGPVPKVCVTSHENDPPEPALTQYRNNISDTNCQSPTSPHSQNSYSPSQSPGLPQQTWNKPAFDMDPYHLQQQQQTNALQQQFEHFNMIHDNSQHQLNNGIETSVPSSVVNSNPASPGSSSSSIRFSQADGLGLTASQEFAQAAQLYMDNGTSQSHAFNLPHALQSMANSKIPDIILTGMGDNSFEADFFGVSDEALKDGLIPLDLDGLQMLTDQTMVADADTENSFRLDQL